jgi:hypothetical protein
MDCIDCHNRPAHRYRAPVQFIGTAISAGIIPRELPEIRKIAVQACTTEYASAEAARKGIRTAITDFYGQRYPDTLVRQAPLVQKAIVGVQDEFARNIFPYMKARWSAYPDNIGHLYYKGCFRCHSGNLVSDSGASISKDCTLCHDLTVQGTPGKGQETAKVGESLPFRHPEEIGTAWQEALCSDCHTGQD